MTTATFASWRSDFLRFESVPLSPLRETAREGGEAVARVQDLPHVSCFCAGRHEEKETSIEGRARAGTN